MTQVSLGKVRTDRQDAGSAPAKSREQRPSSVLFDRGHPLAHLQPEGLLHACPLLLPVQGELLGILWLRTLVSKLNS